MKINYVSTRDVNMKQISSAQAILTGIAEDGGLYVPTTIPKLNIENINEFVNKDYKERAKEILSLFLVDYTKEEIDHCVETAYNNEKFDNAKITPITKVGNASVLELWHGPTRAFKDMALQILPHLLVKAKEKINEDKTISILVATSGDTGKAALEGFSNVDGTNITVFFPKDGVSEVQKLQMITTVGQNTNVIGIEGNFDDAQNAVKLALTDENFSKIANSKGYKFSSANSINWGRLVPQIIYYFSAYADMLDEKTITLGEEVNFVVPSGNFGNILAGYYAKIMGLPIKKLICASNKNNVLTDFINSGVYDRRREFFTTTSPSMDILISSNLERLLYEVSDKNSEYITLKMKELKDVGKYTIGEKIKDKIYETFWADFANDNETAQTIYDVYNKYEYVLDTHTAVAYNVYEKYINSTKDNTKTIIVSTADPFKFTKDVLKAILGEEYIKGKDELTLVKELSKKCNIEIPEGLKDLDKKEILHKKTIDKSPESIKKEISNFLNL